MVDVEIKRLRAHVERLAGDIGERNVFCPDDFAAAAAYIEEEWRTQGYTVEQQRYEAFGLCCANMEVTRKSATLSDEIILIGAHYDTVEGSPGANDNASGVAALLEISRMFKAISPAVNFKFVAFANEESPFFMTEKQGSVVYARAAKERGDPIALMVSLETMGFYSEKPGSQRYPPLFNFFYPSAGNFLGFVSDFRSRREMRFFANVFREQSDFPLECAATFRFIPGVSWSDHRSFWRQGYPAMMVTDTAFYRYPYYHSRQDTPEKLNYPELARVTTGLYRTLVAFAEHWGDSARTPT